MAYIHCMQEKESGQFWPWILNEKISNGKELVEIVTARQMALSTSLRWVEAQDDCDPVRRQLLHRLQHNTVMKQSTKLTQHHETSFFCWLVQLHNMHVVIAHSTSSWIIKILSIYLIIHNLDFPTPDYPNVISWSRLVRIIEVGLYHYLRRTCMPGLIALSFWTGW